MALSGLQFERLLLHGGKEVHYAEAEVNGRVLSWNSSGGYGFVCVEESQSARFRDHLLSRYGKKEKIYLRGKEVTNGRRPMKGDKLKFNIAFFEAGRYCAFLCRGSTGPLIARDSSVFPKESTDSDDARFSDNVASHYPYVNKNSLPLSGIDEHGPPMAGATVRGDSVQNNFKIAAGRKVIRRQHQAHALKQYGGTSTHTPALNSKICNSSPTNNKYQLLAEPSSVDECGEQASDVPAHFASANRISCDFVCADGAPKTSSIRSKEEKRKRTDRIGHSSYTASVAQKVPRGIAENERDASSISYLPEDPISKNRRLTEQLKEMKSEVGRLSALASRKGIPPGKKKASPWEAQNCIGPQGNLHRCGTRLKTSVPPCVAGRRRFYHMHALQNGFFWDFSKRHWLLFADCVPDDIYYCPETGDRLPDECLPDELQLYKDDYALEFGGGEPAYDEACELLEDNRARFRTMMALEPSTYEEQVLLCGSVSSRYDFSRFRDGIQMGEFSGKTTVQYQ